MTSIFESLREFAFKGWPNRSNCRCEDHEPVELPPDKWFDGKWYRNHFTHPPLAEGGLGFASWLLSRIWNHWKEKAPPAHTTPLNLPSIQQPASPQITWLGHATVLIQIDGQNILVDPCLIWSPTLLSLARRLIPSPIKISEFPRIDIVLITHNHQDHLDEAALRAIVVDQQQRLGNVPQFFVPSGLNIWIHKHLAIHATPIPWWGEECVDNLKIMATPAQHWSSRGSEINQSHWCGWLLKTDNHCIYVSGDTGYSNYQDRGVGNCQDFRKIKLEYGPIDLAIISVGDCHPEWFMCTHHISPKQAVEIHKDLGAKCSVAVHWGTFDLSDEFPDQAVPLELARACESARVPLENFFTMNIGETRPM